MTYLLTAAVIAAIVCAYLIGRATRDRSPRGMMIDLLGAKPRERRPW